MMFQKNIKENDIICIWGNSGSGKTIALNELYKRYKKESIFIKNFYDESNFNNDKIKIFFIDDIFIYITKKEKEKFIKKARKYNKKIVFSTSNPEEILYASYIYLLNDCKIKLEGNIKDVLKNEKVIKELGLKNPFLVDLSIQLIHYDLINKIYTNKKELIKDIWE